MQISQINPRMFGALKKSEEMWCEKLQTQTQKEKNIQK